MEEIQSLIVSKDKKLDIIREDIANLREIVLGTHERLVPEMEKQRVDAAELKKQMVSLMMVESKEMKHGLQAVTNENLAIKQEMKSIVNGTKEIKTVLQAVGEASPVMPDNGLGYPAMNGMEDLIKSGFQSITVEKQAIKNEIHSLMTQSENGKKVTEDIKNGVLSLLNQSENLKNGTEEVKNGIISLMNDSQGLKKEAGEVTNGIQSMINESQEAKVEILAESKQLKNGMQSVANAVNNGTLSVNNGILSLMKDSEGMKQDTDKIKNGVQSVAKESKEIPEMKKILQRLVALKIDSDTSRSMGNSDRLFGGDAKSGDCGVQGGTIGLAVADDDSLYSPQPAAKVNEKIEATVIMEDEDSLFAPLPVRVEGHTSATTTRNADIMDDSFSAPLSAHVADDDDDSLFTENTVQENKTSDQCRKWR